MKFKDIAEFALGHIEPDAQTLKMASLLLIDTLGVAAGAANDVDGWQRYRRWVSKAPVPQTRRAGLDASLYTWRGYRRWSDEVRRNWSKDNPDGKDAS